MRCQDNEPGESGHDRDSSRHFTHVSASPCLLILSVLQLSAVTASSEFFFFFRTGEVMSELMITCPRDTMDTVALAQNPRTWSYSCRDMAERRRLDCKI